MISNFWQAKRILITGHTGFKGGWLSLWLTMKGANIIGYALTPPTQPSFFDACKLENTINSITGDIRNFGDLMYAVKETQPEIIVHMAAQSLVRESYVNPIETYTTNIIGTVNILEVARQIPAVNSVLIITSDKCYENQEWFWGYREIDRLGGHDPYACSKGCVELIVSSYRASFLNNQQIHGNHFGLASARAGNVIGGGDWAKDRLIPDIFKAAFAGSELMIRCPSAIRPWQHVLDPLDGYINLMENLYQNGIEFGAAWNFGPSNRSCQPVSFILAELKKILGKRIAWIEDVENHPHEATFLKLDCSKANQRLNWIPKLSLSNAIEWTAEWYLAYDKGDDVANLSESQIQRYEELSR